MTMITPCRSLMPTMKSSSKAMWTEWFYATRTRWWQSTGGPGGKKGSFSTTAIICPCWRESRVRWITPGPWWAWTCPSAWTPFAVVSKGRRKKKGKGLGSLSGFCGSWRTTPWSGFGSGRESSANPCPQPGCGPAVLSPSLLVAKHNFPAGWL